MVIRRLFSQRARRGKRRTSFAVRSARPVVTYNAIYMSMSRDTKCRVAVRDADGRDIEHVHAHRHGETFTHPCEGPSTRGNVPAPTNVTWWEF